MNFSYFIIDDLQLFYYWYDTDFNKIFQIQPI